MATHEYEGQEILRSAESETQDVLSNSNFFG